MLRVPLNFPDGRTTLTTGIDDTDVTITVDDVGALDATDDYALTLIAADDPEDLEIVTVTSISGSVLTVTRAQQDTIAKSWPSGTLVEMRLTKANVQQLQDAIADVHTRLGSGTSAVALAVPITVAGNYEVRGNGSITHHIDYDASGTDAVWKIRANNTTDVLSVTEAGNATIAGTLTCGAIASTGAGTIAHTGNTPLTLQRDTNTNGSLNRMALPMKSSAGTYRNYGVIASEVVTNTDGAEFGEIRLIAIRNGAEVSTLRCRASGSVVHYFLTSLPTSNPGAGILWNDANTVKVGT